MSRRCCLQDRSDERDCRGSRDDQHGQAQGPREAFLDYRRRSPAVTWLHIPSVALPCAPELADSNSDYSLFWAADIALWVQSSGTHSQRPLSWRGWRTRPWTKLLSGTMCAPSTASRGAALWISSLRGSPASRGPTPAPRPESKTSDGYGTTSPGWFAKWDHSLCSWKTSRLSLLAEDSDSFSARWPKQGSMRNGECWARQPLGPPTAGTVFSSWPTPTSADSRSSGGYNPSWGHGSTLTDVAVRQAAETHGQLWATPRAREGGPDLAKGKRGRHQPRGSMSPSLTTQAVLWATPTARDVKGAFGNHSRGGQDLPFQAREFHSGPPRPATPTDGAESSQPMVLNPLFDEWLMGWPLGWTESTRSATASYRSWRRSHSSALRSALASMRTWR